MIFYVERWKRVWNDGAYTDEWGAIGTCDVLFSIAQDRSMILTICHVDHTIGINVDAFNMCIEEDYVIFEGTVKIGNHKCELFKVRMKQV